MLREVLSRTFLGGRRESHVTFAGARRGANGMWGLDGVLHGPRVGAPVVLTVTRAQMPDKQLELTVTASVERYRHDITAMKGMAGR
ncbi:hypothetical protein ACFV0T_37195 [Streptomyces sp. NPDC059582]|uniref:hypothetical protein n=1 Tax=Streptomyces sp. NPDC059582 TaxID=3346875 RepID=UPI0036815EA0